MQNKLSVVQVIDMLSVGGAERVLVTLSNILHDHGHKVKVILHSDTWLVDFKYTFDGNL